MDKYHYDYEPHITDDLDKKGLSQMPFVEMDIFKITLWKVARVPHVSNEIIEQLNKLATLQNLNESADKELTRKVLQELLQCKGVRLPMASTYLRFRNPNVFQILDRHVWHQVYPQEEEYKEIKDVDERINIYFTYLEDLRKLAEKENVEYYESDRIFYIKDKNEGHKIGAIRKSV